MGNVISFRGNSQVLRGSQERHLSQFLSVNGDGTGDFDMKEDYSITPKTFKIQPALSERFRVSLLSLNIQGNVADEGKYGTSELPVGFEIIHRGDSGIIHNYTPRLKITDLGCVMRHFSRSAPYSFTGGIKIFSASLFFLRRGQFLRLNGRNNERLEIVQTDNFTGLSITSHTAKAEGIKENIF